MKSKLVLVYLLCLVGQLGLEGLGSLDVPRVPNVPRESFILWKTQTTLNPDLFQLMVAIVI